MQSGLINKITITPANKSDSTSLKEIMPSRDAVYGDKGKSLKEVSELLEQQGCHNATIKKKNMKGKNKELDKWHSKLRFLMRENFLRCQRELDI